MPHKSHEEVRGVHGNAVLLSFLNDTIGRDVTVQTRDGNRYEGIFAGCSPEFEMGLRMAHTLRDEVQLLPQRAAVIDKLLFESKDVLCMSVLMHDEKRSKGFATDLDYHVPRNGSVEDSEVSSEFEVWQADGEEELELDGRPVKGGRDGWSVDDMFNANNALGVKSTFQDNLSQYTTANVEEDREARLRAEKIAHEIEMNPASRLRARLENDDEERDLNKETPEFQVHSHRRTQNGRNASGPNRGGLTNRSTTHNQNTTRRSDTTSARTGSKYGNGAASRSFTNSALSKNAPCRYPPTERPSAQSVHNEFGQWSEMRTAAQKTTKLKEHTVSSKGLDTSPAALKCGDATPGSPPSDKLSPIPQSKASQSDRVKGLRDFHQNFNNAYQSSPQQESSVPTKPVNAWNKGPPASIRAAVSTVVVTSNNDTTPPLADQVPSSDSACDTAIQATEKTAAPPPTTNTPHALSGAASSSSIAPVDPTPPNTIVCEHSSKKFEFNPDAQPFTPRTVSTATPTPAPQPIPMQSVPLQTPQPMPLTQTMQPTGLMASAPPQMFPYAAGTGVYGTALPVYYSNTQPIIQANATPLMATAPIRTTTARRPQVVQGYVSMPYPISAQYQMPFYTSAPYQQANIPPPSLPPPTSAVTGPPQPFQVIQAQPPQQQAIYSRQLYQGQQPVNYMVAGSRYNQPHEYGLSQQPSSAGSSNGNSSNGHNSQPATPGPVASPAQMYPVCGTPQSLVMSNAPPPLYATNTAMPVFSTTQPGSYVVYSAGQQHMVQMPNAYSSPMIHPSQHMEHYPNEAVQQQLPPQYLNNEQSYQYLHAHQPSILQQQAMVRHNSLNTIANQHNFHSNPNIGNSS